MDNKFSACELDLVPLYDIGEQIINNYKQQLELDNTIASGDLFNSIDWNIVQKDENTLTLEMNIFDYWYYIEYGRKPTQGQSVVWETPVTDISNWIINKIKRGSFIPRQDKQIPTTQQEIKKTAYAIVQKIHKYGYYGYTSEGKHSLEKSLQKSVNEGLVDKFVNGIAKDFADKIVVELNTLSVRQQPKPRRPKNTI